jgi:CheY-like chemotaxis protein
MVPAEVVAFREPVLLVVEDEVLIRLSASDFLRNEGFTVIEAGSAREALTMLNARSDVSVVVTDIHMSFDPRNPQIVSGGKDRNGFRISNYRTGRSRNHQAIFIGTPVVRH